MSDFDQIRERLRQNRAARQTVLQADAENARAAAPGAGAQHLPGDRVFDLVTGQEGTVIGRAAKHVVNPTSR